MSEFLLSMIILVSATLSLLVGNYFHNRKQKKFYNRSTYHPYTPKPLVSEKTSKDRYDLLLEDDRWKRKRGRILDRDNHECQYCHRKDRILNVHHKYYSKVNVGHGYSMMVDPWDYPDDALITLCQYCHEWEHSKRKPKIYWRDRWEHYE